MKKADAISYFGSAASLAKKLNISEAAISQWGEKIPQGRAYQIEVITGGQLKVNPADYKPTPPAPTGPKRVYLRTAPGTKPEDYPCIKRAIAAAQADNATPATSTAGPHGPAVKQ